MKTLETGTENVINRYISPCFCFLFSQFLEFRKKKKENFKTGPLTRTPKNDHVGHYSHGMHPVRLLPKQGQCMSVVSSYPVLLIPLTTRSAHWRKLHKEQNAFVKGGYSLCEIACVFHVERECITIYKSKQLFFSQDYFPDFLSQIIMSEKHAQIS